MDIKTKLNNVLFPFIKIIKGKYKFTFDNKSYEYFIHKYSWNTERVVEIPIILDYISRCKMNYCKGYCGNIQSEYCSPDASTFIPRKFKILEFGNVLQQFVPISWDVLDKYSKGERVIHEDIVDFKPKEKYDLIVSISTLEHVGFNEDVEVIGHGADKIEQNKTTEALNNIKENCLSLNGKLIFTIPLGYNSFLDKKLLGQKLGFDKLTFMKRLTKNNEWAETSFLERNIYGFPFNNANYICVCEYDNTNNI